MHLDIDSLARRRLTWNAEDVVFGGVVRYDVDVEGHSGVWRTVRGRHVFIREGESLDAALKRNLPPRYVALEWRDRIWNAKGKTWDSNKPAEAAAGRDPKELSDIQKKVLKAFSEERFNDVNAVLRRGTGGKSDTKALIRQMDSAFSSISPLSRDVVVYRGGFVDQKTWKNFIEGQGKGQFFLRDSGFKAVSASEAKARDFLNARLVGAVSRTRLTGSKIRIIQEILVPKGTRAIPMTTISSTPKEKELLLNRSSKVRILGVDKKNATLYKVSGVVVE